MGSVLDGNTRTDNVSASDCTRVDVRLHDDVTAPAQCEDFEDTEKGISAAYLFPPGLSNGTEAQLDAKISSNVVPMYDGFRIGTWNLFYALRLNALYVFQFPRIFVAVLRDAFVLFLRISHTIFFPAIILIIV